MFVGGGVWVHAGPLNYGLGDSGAQLSWEERSRVLHRNRNRNHNRNRNSNGDRRNSNYHRNDNYCRNLDPNWMKGNLQPIRELGLRVRQHHAAEAPIRGPLPNAHATRGIPIRRHLRGRQARVIACAPVAAVKARCEVR